jgi:polysaccharide export outer membrane protein
MTPVYHKTKSLLAYFLASLFVTACATATNPGVSKIPSQTNSSSSQASEINRALATLALSNAPASADYHIGPEDVLQITIYNIPDAEARLTPRTVSVRVSQQGLISLPLIGELIVSRLTPSDLETELKKQYEKYIYTPQIGVLVTQYNQRVSVIGAVQKPGVFELSSPKTVIDILAQAGGVNDKAGTQVHIYRQGPQGRESHIIDLLALASNASLITADNASLIAMPVQSGDVINVPPAGMFFIDGAVRSPGAFPLGRRYLLTQALASAGGVDRELYSSDVTIFRRKSAAGVEPIPVDFDAIEAGSAVDPQIEADDVIVVPISNSKYFIKRVFGQIFSYALSVGAMVPK